MLIKLTCDLEDKIGDFFRSRPTMAELSLILWVFQLILIGDHGLNDFLGIHFDLKVFNPNFFF
jgi:hypothetical protein